MFRNIKETSKANKNFRQQTRASRSINSEDSDSDLDSVIQDLSAIRLEYEKSKRNNSDNMAREINYQQLRLFLDIIPNFSGDPCELNNFIGACDETFVQYANESEFIKKLIFRGIIGKLRGKALTLISSRIELDTWDKIKEILKVSFTDQRSFTCLLHELHSLKPNPKESPYNFGIRCQYTRSLIFSSINNDNTMDHVQKIAQISNIEKLILVTFLKYLPPQIQTGVRLKNPDCLEIAMQYVIEEENFNSIVNEGKRNLNQHIPSPNIKAPVQKYSQTQPTLNQTFSHNNSQLQQRFHEQNRKIFPSQPIQITPKQVPQKFYPNQQVLGKQSTSTTNVWKPKNQIPTYKPTPMSTTSRQTPTQPYQFKPQSRPTFMAEELHNIDEEIYTEAIEENPAAYGYEQEELPTQDQEGMEPYTEEQNNDEENFIHLASGQKIT